MADYTRFACVKNMDEGDISGFTKLVNEYSTRLLSRISMDGSAYTLHDFEHHCFDIYKIISTVLFDEKIVYNSELLTSRELYLLNIAILFHDISMSDKVDTKRENHSIKSADYVKDEFENCFSVLSSKTDLVLGEINAIRAIIQAHSNVKDGSVKPSENGLDAPNLEDCLDVYGNTIHTKVLAGVLRLADELDVTCERLGSGRIEDELARLKKDREKYKKIGDEEKAKMTEGYIESYKHWEKLHYIAAVSRGEQPEVIELKVNDEYIERRLDNGDTESAIVDVLLSISDEIQKKLDECVEKCFKKRPFQAMVSARKISLITRNDTIEKLISKRKSTAELVATIPNEKIGTGVTDLFENGTENKAATPEIVDANLEDEIFTEIEKRGLIKYGHFRLNEKYCARDWINTREIIETKRLLKKISEAITKHMMNHCDLGGAIVLGIDMVGALVASRVAFALQIPFSYVGSKRDAEYDSQKEQEFSSDRFERIILLTESMVSCETVREVISRYGIEKKVTCVYTLLYRNNDKYSLNTLKKIPVYSINNRCSIELFPKQKCKFGDNNCKAINQRNM